MTTGYLFKKTSFIFKKFKMLIFSFTVVIIIFGSYNYLQPEQKVASVIGQDEYSAEERNIENKTAVFNEKDVGEFIVNCGKGEKSSAQIVINKSMDLNVNFSVPKGKTNGSVDYSLKYNWVEINNTVVAAGQTKHNRLLAEKGDIIVVTVQKTDANAEAKGTFILSKRNSTSQKLKYQFIPFLWTILFFLLLSHKFIYVFFSSYFMFLLVLFAEKLNFGLLQFQDLFGYSVILFFVVFFQILVIQLLKRFSKFYISVFVNVVFTFIIYSIPLTIIIYTLNFESKVSEDIIFAIFQSNIGESSEFLSDYIRIRYLILFPAIIVFIGLLLFLQQKQKIVKFELSVLIFSAIVFLSFFIANYQELRISKLITESYTKYYKELSLFKQIQKNRAAGNINFYAEKKEKGETYIVIIGESLNKKHMGVYGYFRNTTPMLSKINKNLIIFNRTYSCHTHTVPVLKMCLTEANQYNNKSYFQSLSIIEILKKADVETYWLTNQVIYGPWDNLVSVIAQSADHLVQLNKSIGKTSDTQDFDGGLVEKTKKILTKKTNKNRVIFVHLMGSHAKYSERYPEKEFSKFTKPLKQGEFGTETSKNTIINDYDNSVLYNDYVVGSILAELHKHQGVSGFLYFSDHADDAIRKLGHNAGKFTYEMTQIPMIAWFSNEYKERYPNKYTNLFENRNKLFSNDMLYNSLIGIFNIRTGRNDSVFDLSTEIYSLKHDDAMVMNGKRHYTESQNYIYWQKENAKYLLETGQSTRVFPHRINSVGKYTDIRKDGFNAFEIDIKFSEKDDNSFFVTHGNTKSAVDLETFLGQTNIDSIQKIWFDLKNLKKNNYKEVLKRLQYLDEKFGLKNKSIIESSSTSLFFKEFSDAGWHISYYLPTKVIVELIQNKEVVKMKLLAVKIAKQIRIQNVSAVSFDNRLYPFVKQYLEIKIPDEIDYHTWYAPPLHSKEFKTNLQKSEIYKDQRVKTLLSSYKSQFNF